MQRTTNKTAAFDLPAAIQTTTLARLTDRKPASIRTAVWRHGHFAGIKPVKTTTGRLLWRIEDVRRLLEGE